MGNIADEREFRVNFVTEDCFILSIEPDGAIKNRCFTPGTMIKFDIYADTDYIDITGSCDELGMSFTLNCLEKLRAAGINMNMFQYSLIMPPCDLTITCRAHKKVESNRRITTMEPKVAEQQVIIGTFTIPDNLAKRLSELLTTQTIREKMLNQNIENPTKYEQMEKMLIPIVSEIETIKAKITREHVPSQYQSDAYMWNYDGYEIDGNRLTILTSSSNAEILTANNPHDVTAYQVGLE